MRKEPPDALVNLLLEGFPDCVGHISPDGKLLRMNSAGCALHGFDDPEEVAGRSCTSDILENRELAEEAVRRAAAGDTVSLQYKSISQRGREIWWDSKLSPVRDTDGRITSILQISRDITERKLAEEAPAREHDLLRTVIDNLPEYIYVKDAESRFVLSNIAHARALGAAGEEEIIGKTDSDFFPPEVAARSRVDEAAIFQTGTPLVDRERSRMGPQGDIVWIATTKVPWRNSRGKIVGIVGLSQDVTERKRAEERILRQLLRISALRAIDIAICGSLDLRVTLSVILDQVLERLEVDAAGILLLEPHTQMLGYAAGRGFRTRAMERSRLHLGEGLAGRAALERRIITIPSLPEALGESVRASLVADEEFIAYYGVPLIAKGQVKGVLDIFHRARLDPSEDWLDFLEALAGQAAIAIDNAALFDDLQRSNAEMSLAYDTTLEGWSHALDLRDKETEGHTQRVTEMTLHLARAIGLSQSELLRVRQGALLHDIGKMGIPDSILHKSGPLTDEEWQVMKKHPVYAYEMLSAIAYLRPALDIPYCHHEHYDGTGYPRGLTGEQIPLAARIFAIADAYDAMMSDRPYRRGVSREEALAEIRRNAGTQFDLGLADRFVALFEDGLMDSTESALAGSLVR